MGETFPSIDQNAKASSRRSTIHSLQFLRAVAALLVVLFHGQQAFSKSISDPSFEAETYLFGFGAVGVHIFFVISGFIMVYTTRFDPSFNAAKFFRRRLLRIYPIYWLCAALYLFAHALLGEPYNLDAPTLVGALILLPGNAPLVIGPAWTLAYEMFFYLCFGLAMTAGLERGLVLMGCAFLCSIIAGIFFPRGGDLWMLATNTLLLEFVAGTAIGWALIRQKLPRKGGGLLILCAIVLFALGIAFGYTRLPTVLIWGLPSALLVMGAVMHEAKAGASAEVRWFGRLGDSSYALYLVHILIITLALHLAAHNLGWVPEPAVAALAVAVVALAVAELLHRGIERPALSWLNPTRSLVPVRG